MQRSQLDAHEKQNTMRKTSNAARIATRNIIMHVTHDGQNKVHTHIAYAVLAARRSGAKPTAPYIATHKEQSI